MSLEDTEVTVGGVRFRGVYLAVLLPLLSTIGGGVWATFEFFNRINGLESSVAAIESQSYPKRLQSIEKELKDNNVAALQGKLSELGTSLAAIMEQQKQLLDLRDRIAESEKIVTANDVIVKDIDKKFKKINTEIDDLWKGLDAAVSPL